MARRLLGPHPDCSEADRSAPVHSLRGLRVRCREWGTGGAHRSDWTGQLLVRGSAADVARPPWRCFDQMIAQVRAGVANYPYPDTYSPWPGPNGTPSSPHPRTGMPRWRSSGVATVAAIVSGLAPGIYADTVMVGYSTCGRGATGRRKKQKARRVPRRSSAAWLQPAER